MTTTRSAAGYGRIHRKELSSGCRKLLDDERRLSMQVLTNWHYNHNQQQHIGDQTSQHVFLWW